MLNTITQLSTRLWRSHTIWRFAVRQGMVLPLFIALLLPAVQAAREAASSSTEGLERAAAGAPLITSTTDDDGSTIIELRTSR